MDLLEFLSIYAILNTEYKGVCTQEVPPAKCQSFIHGCSCFVVVTEENALFAIFNIPWREKYCIFFSSIKEI